MAGAYAFVRTDPTSPNTVLKRMSDGTFIPQVGANADYQAYLATGVAADPAAAIVVPIVLAVRPVALRYVLRHTTDPKNILGTLLAALETVLQTTPFVDQWDAWSHASMMYRADLLVVANAGLAVTLGITIAQVDTFLTAAAARPDSGAIYGVP